MNVSEFPGDTKFLASCAKHAIDAAKLSPCLESKRGAVIFDPGEKNVVAAGFNHPPQMILCQLYCRKGGCSGDAIHAEIDALHKARKRHGLVLLHIKVKDGRAVESGPPSCADCSRHLFDAGLSGVWLFHEKGWHFYLMEEFHELSRKNDKRLIRPIKPVGTFAAADRH